MEINNNDANSSSSNNQDDDVAYYNLFDNYSIWTLETLDEESTVSRSNSRRSSAPSSAGNYVSQINQNAEQLVHSTVDVPVHKKRNLIRNLEGMIEELQQKVLRLQDEVEGQDVATTILGVKQTPGARESGSCRCSSSAQLLVLQNKFQLLQNENDNLQQELQHRSNNVEGVPTSATKKLESENRLLQEKLKISMEKLSQVTKDLMKQSCNPNPSNNNHKSANTDIKLLFKSKSKQLKFELQDISDNQILLKNEFFELHDHMTRYIQELESVIAKLLSKHLQASDQNKSLQNVNNILHHYNNEVAPPVDVPADQYTKSPIEPVRPEKIAKEPPSRNTKTSAQLTNGQHTPVNTTKTPPRSSKSSRQDPQTGSPKKSLTPKLKQRSNSLQNDKKNLSLFGRSISISDVVDADSAKKDSAAGSDVGVYCLDILQSVIRSSESPSASLDIVTHQRNNNRGGLRVICRVRPLQPSEGDAVLQVHEQVPCVLIQHKNRTKIFDMDCLLTEQANQEDVYLTLKENALATLRGCRGSIFSYGNTGSGKTYTMQGTPLEGGLIRRILDDLLEHKDNSCFVVVSAIENRSDTFRDIFDGDTKSRLEAKTVADGSLQLLNLSELPVHSDADLNKVIRKLQVSRQSPTSQLTHLIVQLKIIGRNEDHEVEIGKLSLIELACSERFEKSAVPEISRWKETQWVAKSLTSLDEVLQAVAAMKQHVPYRTSRLTHFLQDCLTGDDSSIDVIIQVSPGEKFAVETTASLMLAQRLRNNDSVLSNIAHTARP